MCRKLVKESAQCTPQMYAAAMQGNLIVASASAGKGAATTKKPPAATGKRKGASKLAEETNTGQETVTFVSRDQVKSHIRTINDELPDEILDLLTDNIYR